MRIIVKHLLPNVTSHVIVSVSLLIPSVILTESFFSFLGSFGSILAFRIDAFMIPEFLSFEANGTFAIGMALATSLAIPAAGVFAIYAPKISAYLKNTKLDA